MLQGGKVYFLCLECLCVCFVCLYLWLHVFVLLFRVLSSESFCLFVEKNVLSVLGFSILVYALFLIYNFLPVRWVLPHVRVLLRIYPFYLIYSKILNFKL